MSQKHTTVCDNCGTEAEKPGDWHKVNLHPASSGVTDMEAPDSPWIIRDICPDCTLKVRAWLQGELVAVFRKPRGKNKGEAQA